MSIRTRIFGAGADDPLLPTKLPKGAKADTLESVWVTRAQARRGNARFDDRHRLTTEQAVLHHHEQEHAVELINLSAGGAMVRSNLSLVLQDHVRLELGDGGERPWTSFLAGQSEA